MRRILAITFCAWTLGAGNEALKGETNPASTNVVASLPLYTCKVKNSWPHDRRAFTQGLLFHKGALFESTGLNGQSSLRKVVLETGAVLQRLDLPAQYFAEGLAMLGTNLFLITWLNQKCLVYDAVTFHKETEFDYAGEGWGLTTDGKSLIMSDGTDCLRFRDPNNFVVTRTLRVTAQEKPIYRLNELEYVKGQIFANVWQTDAIIRIDAITGKVVGMIDCRGLLAGSERDAATDVFNGIAYDPATDRLFVTGKNWPKLFEIELLLNKTPTEQKAGK